MKLRIRGDSLRLRLTQSEVKQIAEGKTVQETTRFLNGIHLAYILAPETKLDSIEAQFNTQQIIVGVPMKMAQDWAKSKNISIKTEQMITEEPQSKFLILIEKDFTCLKVRQNESEDESDMFENPNAATGRCE